MHIPDKVTVMKTMEWPILYEGNTGRVVVKYGLQFHQGNHASYFSITGEVYGRRKEPDICGAIHDEIIKRKGKTFQPWVDLHLSDYDGTPMYAVENGFYYCQNNIDSTKLFDLKTVAEHLRIDVADAERIVTKVQDKEWDKQAFALYVETQKPRWAKEAEALRKILEETNE